MRTTISIDDDVLRAARQIADSTGAPLGKAISALARTGLRSTEPATERGGVRLLPVRPDAAGATMAEVNALRDDHP